MLENPTPRCPEFADAILCTAGHPRRKTIANQPESYVSLRLTGSKLPQKLPLPQLPPVLVPVRRRHTRAVSAHARAQQIGCAAREVKCAQEGKSTPMTMARARWARQSGCTHAGTEAAHGERGHARTRADGRRRSRHGRLSCAYFITGLSKRWGRSPLETSIGVAAAVIGSDPPIPHPNMDAILARGRFPWLWSLTTGAFSSQQRRRVSF